MFVSGLLFDTAPAAPALSPYVFWRMSAMRCTVAASAADVGPEPVNPGNGPGAGYASRCHSGATKK